MHRRSDEGGIFLVGQEMARVHRRYLHTANSTTSKMYSGSNFIGVHERHDIHLFVVIFLFRVHPWNCNTCRRYRSLLEPVGFFLSALARWSTQSFTTVKLEGLYPGTEWLVAVSTYPSVIRTSPSFSQMRLGSLRGVQA